MTFTLNMKTGNIMINEKNILYFEKRFGEIYGYIKKRGKKEYLKEEEMKDFATMGKAFIQGYKCDFGKDLNEFCLLYG